jgi:hypothetical protein
MPSTRRLTASECEAAVESADIKKFPYDIFEAESAAARDSADSSAISLQNGRSPSVLAWPAAITQFPE